MQKKNKKNRKQTYKTYKQIDAVIILVFTRVNMMFKHVEDNLHTRKPKETPSSDCL